jgi:hypothetical protein
MLKLFPGELQHSKIQHMFQKPFSILCVVLLGAGIFACKKGTDGTGDQTPAQFQPLTFKFGPDTTSVAIDGNAKVIKNLPRGLDPKQLVAAPVLPSGYSISPNPATAQDYTKGVTFTVTTNTGKTYTMQVTAPVYDAITNPYGIYTPKHLSDIRNGLNDSYVLVNDIQLPDMTAANAAAITGISDYKDYGWYSIGARYVNGGHVIFRGTLDGQNHIIKNFAASYRGTNIPAGIDAGHNGKGSDGLFGNAVSATFKNIGIQLGGFGINDVAVTGESYGLVGSLVGYLDSSTVTNCYVTGNNASVNAGQFTGGLLGRVLNSTITKSYAAITASAGNYAINSGSDGGGLIGAAFNTTITDCSASASVKSAVNVGGLIGSVNTCTIKTSYAAGNVTEFPFNTAMNLVPFNALGGLIGTISSVSPASTIIQNCFATGAVAGANGTTTDFHKGTRIGGLVGQIANSSGPVSVTNSYATGAITRFYINATAPFFTGGLVGNSPNNVFTTGGTCSNYWDKATTGQTVLGGADGTFAQDNGITANGKTTAEMKTQATFVNWDFSSAWNISSGSNNGYPSLRTVIK